MNNFEEEENIRDQGLFPKDLSSFLWIHNLFLLPAHMKPLPELKTSTISRTSNISEKTLKELSLCRLERIMSLRLGPLIFSSLFRISLKSPNVSQDNLYLLFYIYIFFFKFETTMCFVCEMG